MSFRSLVGTVVIVTAAMLAADSATAEPEVSNSDEGIRLYLDASQSGGAREAGIAIERGIRTALHLLGGRIGGREVELIVRDHRANTLRSRRNLEEAHQDSKALAVFGGMHSPPILALRDKVNTAGIPLLVPWAAAGPITRGPGPENWIFRLSVDDTKAGHAITQSAVGEGYRRPFLLLEDTGWGESNLKTMTKAIRGSPAKLAGVARFGWGTGALTARELVEDAIAASADVLFLVANTEEGVRFAEALSALPSSQRLPIRSHWGITGGNFFEQIGSEKMAQLDLRVIQTDFSFLDNESSYVGRVLALAGELFPHLSDAPSEMGSPLGFAHAFDLTLLLAEAAETIQWNGDIESERRQLRNALEKVAGPVEGLVKVYRRPFGAPTPENPDAHEALGLSDLRMGRYNKEGLIELVIDSAPAAKARE